MTTTGYPDRRPVDAGSLPTGVIFTDNGNGTATLAGTPAAGTGGTYTVTITAHNCVHPRATQTFTLTVNESPSVTSADATTFTVGSAGTFSVTSSGFPTASLSESGGLPSGVSFTDNGDGTATLAGTPAAGTGGSYPLTLTADNGDGSPGSQSFTLTVDQAASVTSGASATFTVGRTGTFTVTSTGHPTASLSVSGPMPAGVTFTDNGNGTATLSGTPGAGSGGTYPLTLTATNGVGAPGTQSFALLVASPTTVTALSPSSGPGAGGTKVTVKGTSLTGATAVMFGTSAATDVVVSTTGTSLTAIAPIESPGTATVDVTVTTPGNGTSLPNPPHDQYTYKAPAVTALKPATGPGLGGNKVTVDGTALNGASSVMFGSSAATDVVVSSAGTSLTAIAPIESPGTATVNVTVTTPGGTSALTAADQYTYEAPAVTLLKPAAGPGLGGNKVTVDGTALNGASSVMFGSSAATDVVVSSAGTSLTAIAPTESAGTVNVTVTTPGGTSALTAADQYTYKAPAVTLLKPTSGPGVGGNKVTVDGTALNGASSVMFGSSAATDVVVSSAGTSLTAIAPTESAGTVDVTVTTPGGTSALTAADQYTYLAPTVTAITPTQGPGAGGTKVTVDGTALRGTTSVMFGSVAATGVVVSSTGTSLTALAPAESAATVDVTVITPGGTSATSSADQYTYLAPAVTAIKPTLGPGAGGTKVTVDGTALRGATSVMFGSLAATGVVVSSTGTSLTAVAPAQSAGTVDVTVTTPGGTSATSTADQYTYKAPTVTSVSPTTGSANGGNTVTVRGTYLNGATSVMFGSATGTNVVVASAGTSLTVTAPSHPDGAVDVTVTTPGGTSALTSTDHYTYTGQIISD